MTPASTDRPTGVELRAFLGERLPAAMVSQRFPLARQAAVDLQRQSDRRSLRELLADWWRADQDAGGTSDPVADLWWDLVRRPDSGDGADLGFLELGGHSLLAARLSGGRQRNCAFTFRSPLLLRENATLARFRRHVADAGTSPRAARGRARA